MTRRAPKSSPIQQLAEALAQLLPGPLEPATFTAAEAAVYLGFSEGTLANWRVSGGGPKYIRCGGQVRYLKADLDAWLDAHPRFSTTTQEDDVRSAS